MTPLGRRLAAEIAAAGPMPVERWMAACLADPLHGYYTTRDPLGAAGDFTTAPEISQMFGELLGLWAANAWLARGRPAGFRLVELGPGRGTLMADALRAGRAVPGFLASLSVHLVETSPVLREAQRRALAPSGVAAAWHAAFDEVPPGPFALIANEFLDALPIRQYVRAQDGWRERAVGLDAEGRFVFTVLDAVEEAITATAPVGTIREIAPAALSVVAAVARRAVAQGGDALFVDYGHARSGDGDTLQAVRGHAFVDPLSTPGEADLTAHVDFAAVAAAARAVGARTEGPWTQGEFLTGLGIDQRAAALSAGKSEATRAAIEAARSRLVGARDGEMGVLFKVLWIGG